MNLDKFCTEAGVEVFECGSGWGGRYGYKTTDSPNCSTNGFKTKRAAKISWIYDTFGENTSKALLKLLGEKL